MKGAQYAKKKKKKKILKDAKTLLYDSALFPSEM